LRLNIVKTNIPTTMAPVYRLFAGVLLLLCMIVYTKSVKALMLLEQKIQSPLISVIEPGIHYLGLMDSANAQCLAFFKGNLDLQKEEPTYQGEAIFYSKLKDKKVLSQFNFKSRFASYYQLEDFQGEISIGDGEIKMQTLKDKENVIETSISYLGQTKQFLLPRPRPVFLQQSGEKYSIRFSRGFEKNLSSYTISSLPKDSLLKSLEPQEAEDCLSSLKSGKSAKPTISSSEFSDLEKSTLENAIGITNSGVN